MSPFLCKVKTASSTTAVQIVEKQGCVNRVLEHLGSAHSDAALTVLLEKGRREPCPGQSEFDLLDTDNPGTSHTGGVYRKTAVTLKRDLYYER